jgi:hypothetical protein
LTAGARRQQRPQRLIIVGSENDLTGRQLRHLASHLPARQRADGAVVERVEQSIADETEVAIGAGAQLGLQLALQDDYPGRDRSFPSDAKPIDPAPSNRAPLKLVGHHEP